MHYETSILVSSEPSVVRVRKDIILIRILDAPTWTIRITVSEVFVSASASVSILYSAGTTGHAGIYIDIHAVPSALREYALNDSDVAARIISARR